jgi:hypothetical protein
MSGWELLFALYFFRRSIIHVTKSTTSRELACHLIANGNHIYPLAGISSIAKVLSDHIWLLYLFPQHYDKRSIKLLWAYNVNGFNQIGIRIETKGSGLTVKKCGFRLVYMKDIADLK